MGTVDLGAPTGFSHGHPYRRVDDRCDQLTGDSKTTSPKCGSPPARSMIRRATRRVSVTRRETTFGVNDAPSSAALSRGSPMASTRLFQFEGQPVRLVIAAVETQRQHVPAHRQSERRLVADGGGEETKFVERGIVDEPVTTRKELAHNSARDVDPHRVAARAGRHPIGDGARPLPTQPGRRRSRGICDQFPARMCQLNASREIVRRPRGVRRSARRSRRPNQARVLRYSRPGGGAVQTGPTSAASRRPPSGSAGGGTRTRCAARNRPGR